MIASDNGFGSIGRWTKAAIVLALLGASIGSAAGAPVNLEDKTLFHREHAVGGRFSFIAGPLIYQDRDSERYTRGYRPKAQSVVSGTRWREVYDYPSDYMAYGVYEAVTERLVEAGYESVYACRRRACGDVAGWRLYIGPRADGSPAHQYYFLGRAESDGEVAAPHVAVYVNELDGQPRVILDYAVPEWGYESAQGGADGAGGPVGEPVFFSKGASHVAGRFDARLRAIAERAGRLGDGGRLVVVGHSDRDGDLLTNICLSNQRALSVRDALVREYGVNREAVIAMGMGALIPRGASMAENRRVEVIAAGADTSAMVGMADGPR